MNNTENLKFYIFDWDDNVLCLDSQIYIERLNRCGEWVPTSIGTYEYGLISNEIKDKQTVRFPQNELNNNDYNKAFINFSDLGNEINPIFLSDCILALEKKQYGSSFQAFKKCLIGGHLFMICTARGHNPQTIKKVVEYVIGNVLTSDERNIMLENLQKYYNYFKSEQADWNSLEQWYLNNNFYIGVSSNYFKKSIADGIEDISKAKGIAVEYFMKRVSTMSSSFPGKIINIKIGISDDSKENLDAIASKFKTLDYEINTECFIYDTSKGVCGNHQYKKIKLSEYE